MASLPKGLTAELRATLLDCGPFNSADKLKTLFVDERLGPFRHNLPDANSTAERVDTVISYLASRRNQRGENALWLLVQVLQDRTDPEDACHEKLTKISQQLEQVPSLPPPTSCSEPFWPPKLADSQWRRCYRRELIIASAPALLFWVVLSTVIGIPPFQERLVWIEQTVDADVPFKDTHQLLNNGRSLLVAGYKTEPGCRDDNKGIWYQNNINEWKNTEIRPPEAVCLDWQGQEGSALSDIITLAVDPVNPTTIYAFTSHSSLFVSSDGGRSFAPHSANAAWPEGWSKLVSEKRLAPQFVVVRQGDNVEFWVISQNGDLYLYRADSWSKVDGDGGLCAGLPDVDVLSLLVTETAVLIGTNQGGLWRSVDNGHSCQSVFDTDRFEFRQLWDISHTHPRYMAAVVDTHQEPDSGYKRWQLIDICPTATACNDGQWTTDTLPIWYNPTRTQPPIANVWVQPNATDDGFNWYLALESGQIWQGNTTGKNVATLPSIRRCYNPIAVCEFSFTTDGATLLLLADNRLYRLGPGPWWRYLWP